VQRLYVAATLYVVLLSSRSTFASQDPFRILHVMSYHSSWEWTIQQFEGFQNALKDQDVEYRLLEMDTKRNSSEEWKSNKGREARSIIDSWQPDLVYANDDDAQRYVTRYYVGTKIPFVFSGVNAAPEKYGFVGAPNITGVLEREHVFETISLLRSLAPGVERIAVIMDEGPTWPGVVRTMKEALKSLPNIKSTDYRVVNTFAEYKALVGEYQSSVDAIAPLGIFQFKDKHGNQVDYQDVLRWTTENSAIPDFAFWRSRIDRGTLCAVTVSGYAQGHAAGDLARQILVDGKKPSELAMRTTKKGRPVINLARLRSLGLRLDSSQLLTADIIRDFYWDR